MRSAALGLLLSSSLIAACSHPAQKPAPTASSAVSASASAKSPAANPVVSAAPPAVPSLSVESPKPSSSSPTPLLTLKEGYPTVDALDRHRLLKLESAEPSLTDGDLLTAWNCNGASPCRVDMKLSAAAHLSFLRLFVPGMAAKGKAAPVTKLRLVAGELSREFSLKATGDFLHFPADIVLAPGTVSLELVSEEGQPAVALSEVAFFGDDGPTKVANWRAGAMVVRAQSQFWKSQPQARASSPTVWADELDQTLTPHRRMRASEVIAVPSTPYAVVRRTHHVSCPGATHHYQSRFYLLDTRSSLLAYWHSSSTARLAFNEQRRELRSSSYDPAKGENIVYSLTLTTKGLRDPKSGVPRVAQTNEEGQGGPWLELSDPREPKCRLATAEDVQRLAAATAPTEPLVPDYIQRCELSEQQHLLIDNMSCQYGPQGNAAIVVDAKSGALIAKLSGSFYAYQVRRISGQWLLGAEQEDTSQLFRIMPNGTFKLLWANAGFGVGQASTCLCSA